MKKLLCVLLTLTVCFGLFSAALADDSGEFCPATIIGLGFDADTWMASGRNRATYMLTMYEDYLNAGGYDGYDYYVSAVGALDGRLYLVMCSDVSSLIISYRIGEETASWNAVATPDLFDVMTYELPEMDIYPNANTDIDSVLMTLAGQD